MKKLLLLFVLLIAAVWLGLTVHTNPGYVLVSFGGWRIETTLWFALLAALLLTSLIVLLARLLGGLFGWPGRLKRWTKQRKQQQIAELTKLTLRPLAEGDWATVQQYLPQLRDHQLVPPATLAELALRGHKARLDITMQVADHALQKKRLLAAWESIPRAVRHTSSLVLHYSQQLKTLELTEEAERVLCQALKQNWQEALIDAYGSIKSHDPTAQLKKVEGWVKQRGPSAALLRVLGKLCVQHQLWGKAKEHLMASLAREPHPLAYSALGDVLMELGESDAARIAYQQGLCDCMAAPR